ncbi:type IV pilus assembly protein PilM [Herbaspirillum sp. RV1423]|uniref:type IV pilus assembly protein PilM n=1 Tax=Herbaspirillum sp. RV1423 TaxID=1443993 RepID=UPI000550B721|nr:type IV pilus assembly protein PilM [Herbaspirillum sp. RV1423]
MLSNFVRSFFSKKPLLAGLDICPSEVRMVELSGTNAKHPRLERYARESLPYGAVSSDGIENLRQVMEAVGRLWNRSGSRAREVAISIPAASAFTEIIVVAAGSSDQQRETLAKTYMAGLLPYPIEQALFDYSIIGPSSKAAGHIDLLIAAARKEDIEDRVAIAESLGLKATVADVDSYAALNALLRDDAAPATMTAGTVVALLRLEAHGTHASLACDGRVVVDHDDAGGHQQLEYKIMRNYGLTQEESRRRQRDGSLPDGYVADILAPYVDEVATKAQESLRAMQASARTGDVARIVLAGPGAQTPGLAQTIQKRANVATSIAAPFAGMSVAAAIDRRQLAADAPSCAVACGLALRQFDR